METEKQRQENPEVIDSWKLAAVKWATDRPLTDVLLVAILASGLWAAHRILAETIPEHLETTQQRFERMENNHKEERIETIQAYDKWIDRILKNDAKALNMTPAEYARHVKAQAEKASE